MALIQVIADHLASKNLLMVLDNAEHLLEGLCSGVVRRAVRVS
jgi:hypothetical protein